MRRYYGNSVKYRIGSNPYAAQYNQANNLNPIPDHNQIKSTENHKNMIFSAHFTSAAQMRGKYSA